MKSLYLIPFLTIALIAVACMLSPDARSFTNDIGYRVSQSIARHMARNGLLLAVGDIDLKSIAETLREQGEAFEAFKKANDALIQAKAEGKAVGDLEAKVATISAALDKFGEMKEAIDKIMLKANRPDLGTDKESEKLALEAKGFNLLMRADYQSKGKQIPADLDVKTYTEYKSGFFKLMAGVSESGLSADERKAMSAGVDSDGGYLLPQSTVGAVVAKVYEQSVMRQIANVQTISTDKIEGLIDNDEASAGWVSELGTRSDSGTPTLGKWEIQAHEMYAMPKISQKLIDDAATDPESWLANKVADKFARVEGTAFWQGTGVGQPRGLAAYTTAATADSSRAWGQFEHVVTGANGDFHTTQFDPVHSMMGAFKDAYLNGAQFVMRRAVRTKARLLKESTTNRYLWEPSMQAGQPERLMGYPCRVDEYMPALATGSLSLAFGNFREAYTIVDRIGIRTLRDPYTAKPYVVFYSTKRTGGGAMNYEAVKFIKFST